MPSKPLASLLDRDLSRVAAKEIISVASPLLQELVNHATNALSRCNISSNGSVDVDVAPLSVYRHVIETTDGIEVLIASCCGAAAIPLLRSSFEALLSLQYLLEDRLEYERRSLAWYVCYTHRRLSIYEMLDPSTQKGKRAQAAHKNDAIQPGLNKIPIEEVKKATSNLQSLLAKPHLKEAEAEYHRLKGPPWYHFYGGPKNLEQLSRHLKSMGLYDFLYRPWSRSAHVQDLVQFLGKGRSGQATIKRLREPERIRQVAGLAASFQLRATRETIKWFRPDEDLARWFLKEVKERYDRLNNWPAYR